MRYSAIEGLRAWLAWFVVSAHIVWYTGAPQLIPKLNWFYHLGYYSVLIFIIVSGFVIAHTVIEHRDSYSEFLRKRLFRIYPVYALCLFLAILTSHYYSNLFLGEQWSERAPYIASDLRLEQASLQGWGFIEHIAAHLTLVHGLISDDLLSRSSLMFLAPAWSLSLEWQFYVLALLIIPSMLNRTGLVILSMIAIAGFIAFKLGWLGAFVMPSTLAFGAPYFALGIVTRLCLPNISTIPKLQLAAFAILSGVTIWLDAALPIILWAIFFAYLCLERSDLVIARKARAGADFLFKSSVAQSLGARSYSTYMVHVPIIQILVVAVASIGGISLATEVCVVAILSIPLTLAASFLLYTYIEVPIHAYGKKRFAFRKTGSLDQRRLIMGPS